jgi:hypothetical protein
MFAASAACISLLPMPALAQAATSADGLDLSVILQPILEVVGIVIAAMLSVFVRRLLAAFQTRTGIQLTELQRATVLGAVQTAAGTIETRLDQGVMRVSHVDVGNPIVRSEAAAALNAVPAAAAALNVTVDGVARMIVGAVDTAAHGHAAETLVPAGQIR